MINKNLTLIGRVFLFVFLYLLPLHKSEAQSLSNISSNKLYDAAVQKLVFINDNNKLVIMQSDENTANTHRNRSPEVHIWDYNTGRNEKTYNSTAMGSFVTLSGDGTMVAFNDGKKVETMNVLSGERISSTEILENRITHAVSFFKQNRGLILESDTMIITCGVATKKGRFIRNFVSDGLRHYISPDGTYMVSFSKDNFKVINMVTGAEEFQSTISKENKKNQVLPSIIFSKDTRFFAVLSHQKVSIWDKKNKTVVTSFELTNPDDRIFSFSQDSHFLLGGNDTLKMWSLKTRKEIVTPIVCENKITEVVSNSDDKILAIGDNDGTVKIWNGAEESRPDLFYKNEIENDLRTACVKKEFEKTDDYIRRRQKTFNVLKNKYFNMYTETIVNEKTIFQNVYEEDKRIVTEKQKMRETSLRNVNLQIDSISSYDADKEVFNIHLVNNDRSFDRWQEIKIPLDENAPCFKQNFRKALVSSNQQMSKDLKKMEVFNVKIKTNCSGEDKIYASGEQRETQENLDKDKEDELMK